MRHPRIGTTILLLAVLGTFAGGVALSPLLLSEAAYALAKGENRALREDLAKLSEHDRLSPLFRAVTKAVMPAVVEVRVTKRVQMGGGAFGDLDDLLRRFGGPNLLPLMPERKREFLQRGLGSGVIVDAENGHVLTNYHVVHDADEVEIVLADGRKHEAAWVRGDPQTDLAVLKINADGLVDAPLGDSDKMEPGDWVLAIGAPHGLAKTVTAGIISAKGRQTGQTDYENYLQTDAAINRGNSGGPLVNMRGEVVGINTAIVSSVQENAGIGLSIPSNMARRIMNELIETGKVVRGYLGVIIQNVDERLAKSLNLPTTKGALISEVMDDGPADAAGLKPGDFIVRVDGRDVENVNELRNRVAQLKPDTKVPFVFYRDGEKRTVPVAIAAQPSTMAAAGGRGDGLGRDAVERFGLTVEPLTAERRREHGYDASVEGVLITQVDPGSDAAEQGLAAGQVITHAQGEAVGSPAALARVLSSKEAASGVRLRVRTPRGTRFVFITPAD